MDWAAVLGWTLAVVTALTNVPQLVKTGRTQDVRGLSVASLVVWTVSWSMWLGYAWTLGLWPLAVSCAIGIVVDVVLLAIVFTSLPKTSQWPVGARTWAGWLWPVALAVPMYWVWQSWGLTALAIGLSVVDSIGVAPQLLATLRKSNLAGLAVSGWLWRVVIYSGWVVYALLSGHPESAGWTVVLLPAAVIISVRILADSRRRAQAQASEYNLAEGYDSHNRELDDEALAAELEGMLDEHESGAGELTGRN